MDTVAITLLALLAASAIVWYGFRRMRAIQQVSGQLSGPVEEMKEQLLLTADSAVDRLDDKMAQMEILLSELDRRSNLLAQQSQRQQALHNQLEQQHLQLADWFQQQRRQLEQEVAAVRLTAENRRSMPQQILPVAPPQPGVMSTPAQMMPQVAVPTPDRTQKYSLPAEAIKPEPPSQRLQKPNGSVAATAKATPDKRTLMLELAEQGMTAENIAKKLGVGKGEVMLLLKLRKKAISE